MILDYSKQQNLIESQKFDKRIHIIGAGAGGSWLAFFLLKMGFKDVHIYDFDTIEEHNIPNQLYKEDQIGERKVDALNQIYKEFFNDDPISRLHVHPMKITEANAVALNDVVFNCVDTMTGRKMIYEQCYKYGRCDLYIESRLSIYGAYVYTLAKDGVDFKEEYEATLYDDEEAEVSACGISQTALPSAVNEVSIMIMQMIRWWNEEPFYNKTLYSIPDLVVFHE